MKISIPALILLVALMLLSILFVFPNYSNHKSSAQVNDWMTAAGACVIDNKTENITKKCQNDMKNWFESSPSAVLLNVDYKSITLVSVKYGTVVVFSREKANGGYQWKCKGYPVADVPLKCRSGF